MANTDNDTDNNKDRFAKIIKAITSSNSSMRYREAISTSKILGGIAVGETIIIAMLVNMLSNQEVTTIVTPPHFTEELTIRGDEVSPSYQTSWALFVANLLGNISPQQMTFVLSTLERMIPLNELASAQKQINEQVARLRIRKIEERFTIHDATYDPINEIVWVFGEKETTSIRTGQKATLPWTFEIGISAHLGSPKIHHLYQYEGAPNQRKRQKELTNELTEEKPTSQS